MTNLSNLSPVAADTLYVERLNRLSSAQNGLRGAGDRLVYAFGRRVYYKVAGSRWAESITVHPDTAIPEGRGNLEFLALDSAEGLAPLFASQVADAFASGHQKAAGLASGVAAYEDAASRLEDARLAVEEVESEYASRPWSRYWLVTTSDGHIHASTGCCTCNKGRSPTGFALVPYLSGSTPADAVADLGPALCSVCFPEAPVESLEQATISAKSALALKEHGSEAFKRAIQEASEKAKAKAADRCPGAGQIVETARGYARCPSCGWSCRSTTGKVAAHRRPRYYAVQRAEYGSDKFWTGTGWGPSTKRVAFESREAALAVEGATEARKD